MAFVDVRTLDPIIPGRVYIHKEGFQSVYHGNIDHALDYFTTIVVPVLNRIAPNENNFFLAALWGNEKRNDMVADLFTYGDMDKWSDNPEVSSRVIRDGKELGNRVIGCWDMVIVIGEEEKARRKTSSLKDYLAINPRTFTEIPWAK